MKERRVLLITDITVVPMDDDRNPAARAIGVRLSSCLTDSRAAVAVAGIKSIHRMAATIDEAASAFAEHDATKS